MAQTKRYADIQGQIPYRYRIHIVFPKQRRFNPQCYEDAKTWWVKGINAKDKKKYGHPTIKPIDIVRTLIRNSSSEGDLVFDGFLGSGTTRVACYFEKRNFIGCELDNKFFKMQEKGL